MTRLLVVDDEPRIGAFLDRGLSAHGFRVDVAATGSDGVSRAESSTYDLIVLDLLLPDTDGVAVLRRLTSTTPRQRVLVLSAIDAVDSKVRCLEAGAVDYLPKPFSLAELVARINRRLGEPVGPSPSRWLRVGDLALDLQRRVLRVGDRDVPVSNREFVLLAHLMRRAGEVCTREELLKQVWGYSFDPGSNVVDVYVRRLRAKLSGSQIETVRNVGYCFLAG